MNEIKCPKCHTVFQIDEADYENVVRQIRDKEFEKELSLREDSYKKDKENALKMKETELAANYKEQILRFRK